MVKVKIANSPEINIYENINLVLNLNDNYILDKISHVLRSASRPEQIGQRTTDLSGAYTSRLRFQRMSVAVVTCPSATCLNLGIL